MVKKSKKSKSKRITLRQKHKVLRKVKEHHRKKRKEAKKEGRNHKKKVEKDPGIPNEWPFKEQELKALETRRAQALQELELKKEARKERARKRKLGLLEDEDIANLASAASAQGSKFAEKDAAKESTSLGVAKSNDHSERAFYKELVKVIEASDVILEVLDARDPLGTRCIDMEKMVMKADPSKRIVLLLNKIDLVPKESVEKWLTYLREEMPTVAFKCNTQEQRTKLGWKSSKLDKTSNIPQSSDCLGAENLIKLLKNYSRSHELKLAITVGIVGIPNVGKSSLVNSLKRSRVVNVGPTPGVTRSMQEVQLDKKVKLLDCPGVVMLKSSNSGVSIALRNCKRVEKMEDPISPVKEILNPCPHETLLSLYKVSSFTSVDDFLQKVATLRGKLKKGGIVVIEAEEGWVQCDKCECWQHQICALFNIRRNGEGTAEYTCHNCYVQETKHGLCMPLPESALLGVKDLPRVVLSDHIEERLLKRHRDERQDRAKLSQKSFDEVPGAGGLVDRAISPVDKKLEKLEGVEVRLFGMYVQEFGAECAFPNQRRVYLSSLDSVKYFKPEIKTVSGKGLQVREIELPAKVVTCPKRAFNSQSFQSNSNEDGLKPTMEPYDKWQPGRAHSLAQYQVDVWSEKCLPPGTVHLWLPRLVQVARRLGIDFAPTMVGFDYRSGRCLPFFDGIVVCAEFKSTVLKAYAEDIINQCGKLQKGKMKKVC